MGGMGKKEVVGSYRLWVSECTRQATETKRTLGTRVLMSCIVITTLQRW